MYVLTTVVYPLVLALLCVGTGLLVDRLSGGRLPGLLLPAVGAAGLIAVAQLTTWSVAAAPATPVIFVALAVAGFAVRRHRVVELVRAAPRRWAALVAMPLVYVVALAPVLLAGRPTISGYQVISDPAFHIMGADYLLRHGQDFAHLDLRNSYGLFLHTYYAAGYPSGADALFGASANVLGLSLLWTFQPFMAAMLAIAAGPAVLLARRAGLTPPWAVIAGVASTVPALVYAYVLTGSVKEITALAMVLTLGALVVLHRRWMSGPPTATIPFALAAAAGVSALGVGFAAWAVVAAALVLAIAAREIRSGRLSIGRAGALAAAGVVTVGVAALPTWLNATSALQVTKGIATTSNAGNLSAPLRTGQVFGTWFVGDYTRIPAGGALELTYALIGITVVAAILGLLHLVRTRARAYVAWLVSTVLVGGVLLRAGSTWTDAKTLMITSPVVVLAAWAGVAGLRATSLRLAAPLLAAALLVGVLVSDALQYHTTNLAPTARYEELATVNTRFAGRGPTLFTDFDEYAMYVLRDMDIGGPNFSHRPPALGKVVVNQGEKVSLNRVPLNALRGYPLIVTRHDPTTVRPPADYRLAWQGTDYEVWQRSPSAGTVLAKEGVPPGHVLACSRVGVMARFARRHHAVLVTAGIPRLRPIPVRRARIPTSWTVMSGAGVVMSGRGTLRTELRVPRTRVWHLWLQGELAAPVTVSIDGRTLATVRDRYSGAGRNPDTVPPIAVHLRAGRHVLRVERSGPTLAPGDGGTATLHDAFLSAVANPTQPLSVTDPARWHTLCGASFGWINVVRLPAGSSPRLYAETVSPSMSDRG